MSGSNYLRDCTSVVSCFEKNDVRTDIRNSNPSAVRTHHHQHPSFTITRLTPPLLLAVECSDLKTDGLPACTEFSNHM
jgi:hypothetical protein